MNVLWQIVVAVAPPGSSAAPSNQKGVAAVSNRKGVAAVSNRKGVAAVRAPATARVS